MKSECYSEAVDSLFETKKSKCGRSIGNRGLKPFRYVEKVMQGRLRQNLLGKRGGLFRRSGDRCRSELKLTSVVH